MSKYTTEVRYICEHYAGLSDSVGFESIDEVIETSRPKIFDFSYPIFDNSYKSVLETKILKHYYTREIGAESVGLWKLWLDTRLNEIMPYYNQLYQSTLIEFNPLYDTDITTDKAGGIEGNKTDKNTTTETINRDIQSISSESSSGTSSSTNNQNSNDWDYFSDTPQGGINGLDDNTYLTNARHLTNATQGTGNGTTNGTREGGIATDDDTSRNKTDNATGTFKNTESWMEHITGKRGTLSYSKMLQEYRDTFLNIDMKVIDELKDLFMNVW